MTNDIPPEPLTAMTYLAMHDLKVHLPRRGVLRSVRRLGLEDQLPEWYDFETGQPNLEACKKELDEMVVCLHQFEYYSTVREYDAWTLESLVPDEFFSQYAEILEKSGCHIPEVEEGIHPLVKIWGLNYLMVREVLRHEPTGRIDSTLFSYVSGLVSQAVGLEAIRDVHLEMNALNPDPRAQQYEALLIPQLMRTYQQHIAYAQVLDATEGYDPGDQLHVFHCGPLTPQLSQG